MVYLDYSATTPVNEEVLDSFSKVCLNFPGNANSLHRLGVESRKLMDASTRQVAELLHVKESEVIFTSGASEANNLALQGVVRKYPNRGKHIITTKLEHSSVLECMSYLEKCGYTVDYVPLLDSGLIDFEALKKMVTKDTLLVSICHVNSELGICQDIDKIGQFLADFPTTIFHVDGTQAVGKIPVSLKYVDLYSFSAHKFFGLKGIGCLIKKNNIELEPLIFGGKSQTNYRSGTPALPLIVSCSKALRLILTDFEEKYRHVETLSCLLKKELEKIDGVILNSGENAIPHIVNISVPGIKSETMLHALEEKEIYISTKTACSKDSGASLPLVALGKESSVSNHSLRISISYLTTEEEIHYFIRSLKEWIQKLNL